MAEEITGAEALEASESQVALEGFWPKMTEQIRAMPVDDFKHQELPLARIKKIMKLDEEVKMISAEAPLLFSKAAEMFIHELSLRAWIHTEDNKRRTLQRNDIAMAISKCDQFDFLIDIVPRDEIKQPQRQPETKSAGVLPDQVQYYFQLAQQHQAALQQQQQQQQQPQPQSIQIISGGQVQTIQVIPNTTGAAATVAPEAAVSQPQTVHLHVNAQGQLVQQAAPQPQPQPQPQQQQQVQIIQQVVGADGQLQQIPVQLNAGQLQMVRMAAQPAAGAAGQQTIVLQQAGAAAGQQVIQQGQQVYITQQESA